MAHRAIHRWLAAGIMAECRKDRDDPANQPEASANGANGSEPAETTAPAEANQKSARDAAALRMFRSTT